MIVVLPHDSIVRILDHATTTPGAASEVGSRRAASPLPSEAGPALSEDIIDALNNASTTSSAGAIASTLTGASITRRARMEGYDEQQIPTTPTVARIKEAKTALADFRCE